MKKFMMGAMTGLLLASAAAPALAQDGRWGGGGDSQGQGQGQGQGGGQGRGGGWSNRNAAPQAQAQAPAPAQGQAPAQAAPAAPVPHNRSGQAVRGLERGDRGAWSGQPAGDANRSGRDANRDGRAGAVDQNRNGDQNRARNWDQNRGSGQVQNRNWDQNRGAGQVQNRNGDQNRGRDWDRNGAGDRNWNGDRNWSGGRGDRDRPRYDRRYYPPVYHAQNRYRGSSYRPPYGFYDRSWAYGDILPRGWFGSSYYIDQWSDYGLPIPPIGYEWTRVGDDAVLVDTYSGRIVQVVYDLFW